MARKSTLADCEMQSVMGSKSRTKNKPLAKKKKAKKPMTAKEKAEHERQLAAYEKYMANAKRQMKRRIKAFIASL